ncbi:MAG: LysR family transcriptional regulator [Mycetocola sp.]
MISADDLRYFLEVARTGKLVSAGKGLGVDHTTVGRRISRLELAVGTRLFVRSTGRWKLTEPGERLLSHAESVESSLAAAAEELGSAPGRLSGTLRIAAPDGFGAFVLSPSLGRLRKRHPDVAIELVTATRLNFLDTKEFDIGISLTRPVIRGVNASRLATYTLGLYGSHEYLADSSTISEVADLGRHSVIGYVDSLLDIPELRFLHDALPELRPAIQTNNITGQWMAAVAGLGVAVLPLYVGETDERLARILASQLSIRRTYWLAIPQAMEALGRTRAARAELFALVRNHPYLEGLG